MTALDLSDDWEPMTPTAKGVDLDLSGPAEEEGGDLTPPEESWDTESAAGPEEEDASFRGIVDAARRREAVIELELDGTVCDANANFLAATGYTLEEIRGRHHRTFCDASYAASTDYAAFWERLRGGEYVSGDFRLFRKTGEELWIRATCYPVAEPGGSVVRFLKIARDITAQKQADLAVARALEHLAAVDIRRETADALGSIRQISREIAEIASAIEEVANRTQLVGLNAQIEAAHAGDHGRGFGVVAREIRRLAGNASEAVDQIRTLTGRADSAVTDSGARIETTAGNLRAVVEATVALGEARAAAESGDAGSAAEFRSRLDSLERLIAAPG